MQNNNSFKRRFNLNQYIINANFLQNYGRKKNHIHVLGRAKPRKDTGFFELKKSPRNSNTDVGCWIELDNKNVPRNLPGPPGNTSVVQQTRSIAFLASSAPGNHHGYDPIR